MNLFKLQRMANRRTSYTTQQEATANASRQMPRIVTNEPVNSNGLHDFATRTGRRQANIRGSYDVPQATRKQRIQQDKNRPKRRSSPEQIRQQAQELTEWKENGSRRRQYRQDRSSPAPETPVTTSGGSGGTTSGGSGGSGGEREYMYPAVIPDVVDSAGGAAAGKAGWGSRVWDKLRVSDEGWHKPDMGYDSSTGFVQNVSANYRGAKEWLGSGTRMDTVKKVGMVAGAYGAANVGLRELNGGGATYNNRGERDIAGIPFI